MGCKTHILMTSVLILSKLRSFCREFNTEIADSEFVLDLLNKWVVLGFCHRFRTWQLHVHCSLYCQSITVWSAELSFLKLKIIKTYLRSTISQEKLDCLALLAIENKAAKQLNTIVRQFCNHKVRQCKLMAWLQLIRYILCVPVRPTNSNSDEIIPLCCGLLAVCYSPHVTVMAFKCMFSLNFV